MGKLCVSYFDIFVQVWMNKFSRFPSQFHKSLNVIEEEGKKGHISRFVEFIYTTRVTLFGLERWCYNFTIIIPLLWPSRPQNFPIIILMPPPKLISAPELNNEHDTSHRFIQY